MQRQYATKGHNDATNIEQNSHTYQRVLNYNFILLIEDLYKYLYRHETI